MPTTNSNAGVLVTVSAGRGLLVQNVGESEGRVEIVAGALGAGYDSRRVLGSRPELFGPYGVDTILRVRAISGTVQYSDAISLVGVMAVIDPLTRLPTGQLVTDDGNFLQNPPRMIDSTAPATYTMQPNDGGITSNDTGRNITVTLPDPAKCTGRYFPFKKWDSSATELRINGPIEGQTQMILNEPMAGVVLYSDGARFLVFARSQ